jgi:CheY-like chemotaxis protein
MQIAKLLLKEDIVSLDHIKEAIEKKYDTDMELSEALIELGHITEPELLDFLGKSYGVPVISIENHSIDKEVLELIPREIAIENRLIPLSITGSALTVAMSDPSNIILVDEISFLTEKNIIPVVVSERSIIDMLEQYYDYSKNYTGYSESSLRPAGNGDIDIDKIVRELEEYKLGGTSEKDISASDLEEDTNYKLAEQSSHAERANTQNDIPEVNDVSEEQMDEPEELYKVKNEPGIVEEPGTRDKGSISHENIFTSDPVYKDSPAEPHTEIQNNGDIVGDINETKDESAELTFSNQELTSINESSVVHEEPYIETQTPATTTDPVGMKGPSNEISPHEINQSVLVIDNSRTVQKLITLALNRSGYTVSAVSGGMEALSCLNEVNPDLIFIEINLPHMDGYKVCKIIKSHGLMKHVPIVMLSGKDGIVDKVRSKMAGANGHISKPFAANELVDAAQRYARSNARGLVSGQR